MAAPQPTDADLLLQLRQDFAETRDRQDSAILELQDSDREIVEGVKQSISLLQEQCQNMSSLMQDVKALQRHLAAIENNQAADRDLLEEVNAIAAEYKSHEAAIKRKESGKFSSYLFALILAGFLGAMQWGAYERKQELSIGVWMPCLVLIGLSLGVNIDQSAIGSLVVKK